MFPILIVDDSREDLMLAERVLHACKILNPIHALNSGAECLSFLNRRTAADEGALVLLDLSMTPVSGIDVLRGASDTAAGSRSLFVMLSGITDVKLLREGYQLGAQTFLVKPLKCDDVLEFLSTVKEKIKIDQTSDGYGLHWMNSHSKPTQVSALCSIDRALSLQTSPG